MGKYARQATRGLQCFTDQELEHQILYCQLMFCTGMVLPCFDQPDLKSNMNLELITHHAWYAVSNSEIILEAPVNYEEEDEAEPQSRQKVMILMWKV